jgi:putative redox protein
VLVCFPGPMAGDKTRSVSIERTSLGRYRVTNPRGGALVIGSGLTDTEDFTPVELLLAAIGGCTGADVDFITHKRSEPDSFTVTVSGEKIRDDGGNRLVNLTVDFDVEFPQGEAGDAAREVLPSAVIRSHDRLCTVSRTVQRPTPISTRIAGEIVTEV